MFKAPKRVKKRKQVLSTSAAGSSSDDDDEKTGTSATARAGGGGGGAAPSHNHDHDEHEEDGIAVALEAAQMKIKARKDKQKKKKQKRGTGADRGTGGRGGISFDPEDHEDETDDGDKKDHRKDSRKNQRKHEKKGKKRDKKHRSGGSGGGGGMGFGGVTMSFRDEDDEPNDATASPASVGIGYGASSLGHNNDDAKEETETNGAPPGGGSLYGAAGLEALRSKQKVYVAPRGDDQNNNERSKQDTTTKMDVDAEKPATATTSTANSKSKDPGLGDGETSFIPLDGSNIVAGDDALAYMQEEDDERDGMASPEAAARRKDKRTLVGTDRLSNVSGADMDGSGGVGGGGSILGGMGSDAGDAEIDDGGRRWEEEVARRAGVGGGAGVGGRGGNSPHRGQESGQTTAAASPAATLETMKGTISKTLAHLRQRREDLESSHDRRRNELEGVQQELRRQEEDLRAGGSSFEYYQDLRVDIADWVGALRNLSVKVDTITDAIREQEVDAAERRRLRSRQREDDAAAILQAKGLIDSVIGRQVQLGDDNNSAPAAVDEFGRDIQSAEALARERRIVRRRRVRKESSTRIEKRQQARKLRQEQQVNDTVMVFDDSDADMSDNEVEEQAQRIDALEEALLLAKDELDDRFCSLTALQDLFVSWKKHSPEDYERCYAKLSLVDMAAVLVKAETCTKINTLQCSNNSISDICSVANFDWVLTASSFESSYDDKGQEEEKSSKDEGGKGRGVIGNADNEKLVYAITRKVLLPYLLMMMGTGEKEDGQIVKPLYDPFSSRQTTMVKGLCSFLKTMLTNDVDAIQQITKSITSALKASLDEMAVLLVKPEASKIIGDREGTDDSGADDDQSEKEAGNYSIFEQVYRLEKFISNAATLSAQLSGVGDVQRRDLASLILMEAIAARLLPMLSILKNAGASGHQKAETTLQNVWNHIKAAGWLDDEGLMLQTAPIRAAIGKGSSFVEE